MEDKKSHLQNLAGQLQQWDAEIDELKAGAGKANAEARPELLDQIAPIRFFPQPTNYARRRKRRRASWKPKQTCSPSAQGIAAFQAIVAAGISEQL
jgi:hypothetical protein